MEYSSQGFLGKFSKYPQLLGDLENLWYSLGANNLMVISFFVVGEKASHCYNLILLAFDGRRRFPQHSHGLASLRR